MEKHQPTNPLSQTTPIDIMGGKELREESKVWEEIATGEARMMLMKKMMKEDLAFADLESFGAEFNNKLKSIKLKNKFCIRKYLVRL